MHKKEGAECTQCGYIFLIENKSWKCPRCDSFETGPHDLELYPINEFKSKIFGKTFLNKGLALLAIKSWQLETKQPDSELKNIYLCPLNLYGSIPDDNRVLVSYNSYLPDSNNTTAYFELFVQRFTDEKEDAYTAIEIDGVVGQIFSVEVGEYCLETTHVVCDRNSILYRIRDALEKLEKKPVKKKEKK